MGGTDAAAVEALLSGAGGAAAVRDLIRCSGPDTVRFLHSLLSQSVEDLAEGEARWSFLLEPQGRLVALLRVRRTGAEAIELDTDAGVGSLLRSALLRYRIRTRCELSEVEPVEMVVRPDEAGVLALVDRPATAGPDELEVARVLAGVPLHGRELGAETIPNATGLVPIATARKGCYVGQELVERIDSRGGNVPERLVVLDGATVSPVDGRAGDGPLEPAVVELRDGAGAVVGRLTSAVVHRGRLHAIGWVRRAVATGAALEATVQGRAVPVVVRRDVGTR